MATQQGFVVAGSSASLQAIPVPSPKDGEAVVRVLIAGVCNTDLEIMKGYMGFAGVVGVRACRIEPRATRRTTD